MILTLFWATSTAMALDLNCQLMGMFDVPARTGYKKHQLSSRKLIGESLTNCCPYIVRIFKYLDTHGTIVLEQGALKASADKT